MACLSRNDRHMARIGRIYGLGSLFGKTLRDSRWAALVVFGLLALFVVAGGWVMTDTYGSPAARRDLAAMAMAMPPAKKANHRAKRAPCP